jgi:HK97 family phage major capsid protein
MATIGIDRKEAEALFDQTLAGELQTAMMQQSVALQAMNVIPMGTSLTRIPVLSALPTARFLNAYQEPKPTSNVAWDQVILTAEEIAVIIPIDESVIEDASIDVVSRTTALIVQEFSRVLDAAVFFGTGAPSTFPKGGLVAHALATHTRTEQISDGLNSMFSDIENLDNDVSNVVASKGLRGILRGQKDGLGAPLYYATEGDPNVGRIYGVDTRYPLGWDKDQALAIALDNRVAVIGLRHDVRTKILDQASLEGFGNLAERDSIAIRAVMRVGFALANPVSLRNPTGKLPISVLKDAVIPPKSTAK